MHHKFGRRLQDRERFGYDFATEFQVESYLKHKGLSFTRRFDANSYLYITKALDYFDLTVGNGGEQGYEEGPEARTRRLAKVFARSAHVKFLVVSFTSDWLYPSYHSKELVSALTAAGADVTYLDIQSTWGHDAFLLEVETMTGLISSFMDRLAREEGIA
jgi:homoserine O-acetyltransferase